MSQTFVGGDRHHVSTVTQGARIEKNQWLEYCLQTSPDKVDALTEALTAAGVTGLVVEDEADFLKFLEENRKYWDYVDDDLLTRMKGAARVKFYVPDDPDGVAQADAWLAVCPGAEVSVTPMAEEDWANGWKKYYRPLEIGRRLYVVPEWVSAETPEGRAPLILNPGLAFGTGSHPTTQLCLEGVEDFAQAGQRVLDLGCGSGILSIAALVLGADYALGVDIDPKAPDVAQENAQLNRVPEEKYRVVAGDVLGDKGLRAELGSAKWDLILANIVADVIIPLSGFVGEWLAPGGRFLCSGIIDTRAQEVRRALERNGFTILRQRERKGWYAFETVRRDEV